MNETGTGTGTGTRTRTRIGTEATAGVVAVPRVTAGVGLSPSITTRSIIKLLRDLLE